MKNILYLIGFFLPNLIFGQVLEEFSDGNLNLNPTWQGDLDSFEIDNNRLHLNAPPASSESFLAFNSIGAVEGFWEFYVELAFNPSSGNKALVYLMSDSANLKGTLNGYFVMIGNTNDEVSLYRQTGNIKTEIIDGVDAVTNKDSVKLKVKVFRDDLGNFELFIDTSAGQNTYHSQGVVQDNNFLTSSYFGFLCDYTATRSDKFWMDDILISTKVFTDTYAPKLLSYNIPDLNRIELVFNEKLDSLFALDLSQYSINGTSNIISCNYFNKEVQLDFSQGFLNNFDYNLSLRTKDVFFNSLDTILNFTLKENYPYQSVLINEIYADENPSFGMPPYEFIEIKNTTQDTLYLEDCLLSDAGDTTIIPSDTLFPFSFLILCKTTAQALYAPFGKSLGVPNFPSLNNAEDELHLLNKYGEVIDEVFYEKTWYREQEDALGNQKEDGGFSLERIALLGPCSEGYNWFPSIDTLGASPGEENAALSAIFLPEEIQITEIELEDDSTMLVYFNQEIPFIQDQNCAVISVAGENPVEQVYTFNGSNLLYVLLNQPIVYGLNYQVIFEGLKDCNGTALEEVNADFFRFEAPNSEDLVLNEILFNPISGGSDYLEIYNKSAKNISLKDFQIIEYDVFDPSLQLEKIYLEDLVIAANSYLVLTEDSTNIYTNFLVEDPLNLKESKLPNFNDDQSIVVLKLPNGQTIDSLFYNKNWHYELLDLQDGASLERITVLGETNNRNNWSTAAKTYGYGTPTAINSQVFVNNLEANVQVAPEVFSPNEDGDKDYCILQYNNGNSGESINITVYDLLGRETKLIAQNHSLGGQNSWKWNGTNNDFQKADIGIYIILFEVFDLEGKPHRIKKKVVLGTSLN